MAAYLGYCCCRCSGTACSCCTTVAQQSSEADQPQHLSIKHVLSTSRSWGTPCIQSLHQLKQYSNTTAYCLYTTYTLQTNRLCHCTCSTKSTAPHTGVTAAGAHALAPLAEPAHAMTTTVTAMTAAAVTATGSAAGAVMMLAASAHVTAAPTDAVTMIASVTETALGGLTATAMAVLL
jgi:hypothetical protein